MSFYYALCDFCGGGDAKEIMVCYSHLRLRGQPSGYFVECGMCCEYNNCVRRNVCNGCIDEFRDGLNMKSKFRCRVCVMKGENHRNYFCKSVCGDCYEKFEERNGMVGRTLPKPVTKQDRRCCVCNNKVAEYYMESCSVHY